MNATNAMNAKGGDLDKYTSQMTAPGKKFAFFLAGFIPACIGGLLVGQLGLGQLWAVICGFIGMIVSWRVVAARNPFQEKRADAVTLAIIGTAVFYICEFVLVNLGVQLPSFSQFNADWHGWHIFIFVVAILFVIFNWLWVYGMHYKQAPDENTMILHGDDWIKPGEPHLRYDSGITLDCTADEVWPYLKQSGQDKAGWYSFDWLERLFTFDIHNHYTIHSEWQDLKVGDFQWFHQAPLSIGEWVTEVSDEEHYWATHSDSRVDVEGPNQEKALNLPGFRYFCWTWNWYVYDIEDGKCRFIWRCDCTFGPYATLRKWFIVAILGTASIVMGHGYMNCSKRISNGTQKITEKTE